VEVSPAANLDPIPIDRFCVALDTPDLDKAVAWAKALKGEVGWFKVGLTLFAGAGPRAVEAVAAAGGGKVFLDLKLHDIPAQVKGAVSAASDLGAGLLTVHASGGPSMLAAAAEGRKNGIRVVAVTVLTSLSAEEWAQVCPGSPPDASVARLRDLAVASGVDGIVLSPQEAAAARASVPAGFWLVTPGIRAPEAAVAGGDDQARTGTPRGALADGADLLVIGRPLTGAADPAVAARALRGVL
jgi:orotidine-5'-phosphate decarboxylase